MCIRNKVRGNGISEICLKHGRPCWPPRVRGQKCEPVLSRCKWQKFACVFGANADKPVIFSFTNLYKLNLLIENSPNKESSFVYGTYPALINLAWIHQWVKIIPVFFFFLTYEWNLLIRYYLMRHCFSHSHPALEVESFYNASKKKNPASPYFYSILATAHHPVVISQLYPGFWQDY